MGLSGRVNVLYMFNIPESTAQEIPQHESLAAKGATNQEDARKVSRKIKKWRQNKKWLRSLSNIGPTKHQPNERSPRFYECAQDQLFVLLDTFESLHEVTAVQKQDFVQYSVL